MKETSAAFLIAVLAGLLFFASAGAAQSGGIKTGGLVSYPNYEMLGQDLLVNGNFEDVNRLWKSGC